MVEACLYPVDMGTATHCRGTVSDGDESDAEAGDDAFAGERVGFFASGRRGEFEISYESFSAFIP